MAGLINKNTSVGLVGVGLMGHGIALNIVKNSFPLTILDHPGNQPVDDLLALGVQQTESLSELAAKADVIILCVTGTPQIEDILYQPHGLLNNLKPNTVVIDCSTAIPSSTEKIAADIAQAQSQFLDAPMTRTPKEAAQGRLNLIVGGDPNLYAVCLPLLEAFAENIVHAGPVGSGHRMKLIHNFVSLGFSTVLAEAAACASKTGVDPHVLLDILSAGGGRGVVLDRLAPFIRSEDDSGFQFTVSNAHKDLRYYTQMAEDSGCFHDTATAIERALALGIKVDSKATMPQLIKIMGTSVCR